MLSSLIRSFYNYHYFSFYRMKEMEPMKTRDMTKDYFITNDINEPGYKTHPLHSYGPHFIITKTTTGDVAEIETVL